MSSTHSWQPELYDDKLAFVSKYGKGVLELLQAREGERILDLGCGTGDLSHQISLSGAVVTGLDNSAEMVRRAQEKYPDLAFIRGNAEHFETGKRYSAVFSNAALHWIKDAGSVAASVWNVLEEGGRFVAEFGGKGNVETIVNAIGKVLSRDYGIDADSRNPWYFPSIGEYSRLLEKQGFRVIYALHFDRPTPLEDGENGLMHWLNGLAADEFFKSLDDSQRKAIYGQIAEEVRSDLYHNGIWSADYKRLRIAAVKP